MVSSSFKHEVLIFDNTPVWFFFVPTIDNYADIFGNDRFGSYLVNSTIVGIVSTVLTLAFGDMAAHALASSLSASPGMSSSSPCC